MSSIVSPTSVGKWSKKYKKHKFIQRAGGKSGPVRISNINDGRDVNDNERNDKEENGNNKRASDNAVSQQKRLLQCKYWRSHGI
jgi:hypothetical protein